MNNTKNKIFRSDPLELSRNCFIYENIIDRINKRYPYFTEITNKVSRYYLKIDKYFRNECLLNEDVLSNSTKNICKMILMRYFDPMKKMGLDRLFLKQIEINASKPLSCFSNGQYIDNKLNKYGELEYCNRQGKNNKTAIKDIFKSKNPQYIMLKIYNFDIDLTKKLLVKYAVDPNITILNFLKVFLKQETKVNNSKCRDVNTVIKCKLYTQEGRIFTVFNFSDTKKILIENLGYDNKLKTKVSNLLESRIEYLSVGRHLLMLNYYFKSNLTKDLNEYDKVTNGIMNLNYLKFCECCKSNVAFAKIHESIILPKSSVDLCKICYKSLFKYDELDSDMINYY